MIDNQGMRPTVISDCSWRAAGLQARIRAIVLLALVACSGNRAVAQMSADSWSADTSVTPRTAEQAAHGRAGPDFPPAAYSAIGSTFAATGHFAELGWDEAQIAAYVDGVHAAFQGKPGPFDEKAQQLLSEIGRRTTDPGFVPVSPGQVTRDKAGPHFPPAAYGAIGSYLAATGHFAELGWNDAQISAFLNGMRAAFQGKPFPFDEKALRLLAVIRRQIGDIADRQKLDTPKTPDRAGWLQWFMRRVQTRLGLQQTDSGLAYRVEQGRGGIRPRPGDTIVFTCTATTAEGTKVPQMSGTRIRMKMDGLLPGLMEGLKMMSMDSSAVFVLPPTLSFDQNKWPDGVRSGSPLMFSVTLHEVIAGDAPP
jgi:FKBP-type peptidyl-prolyl cis-trans isomerase